MAMSKMNRMVELKKTKMAFPILIGYPLDAG